MKKLILLTALYFYCFGCFAETVVTDTLLIQKYLAEGLPVVYIETVDAEEPSYEIAYPPANGWGQSITNATKVPGRVVVRTAGGVLYDSGEFISKSSGMTIKVRGNWSATNAKKPFKIKLQKKADMLARGDKSFRNKNWILLSVKDLNPLIGLKVNELMGLQWTPRYIPVNVIFNNDYRGLYLLMESVNRGEKRLDVDEETGYIVELDPYWWNEDIYIPSVFPEAMNYTFKYPDSDDITEEQLAYITAALDTLETSLSDGSYTERLDVESFARWMLAHDILGNTDGAGSNIYLTKYDSTATSPFKMGCMWDFDNIMLKQNAWDEAHGRFYFTRMMKSENKTYTREYFYLWERENADVFSNLISWLETFPSTAEAKAMDSSMRLNNQRWRTKLTSTAEYAAAAIDYFRERQVWLDSAVTSLTDLKIIANDCTRLYGDANPKLTYTIDGVLLSGEPVIACEVDSTFSAGVYPITIGRGSVTNKNLQLVEGSLTIEKAPLHVWALDTCVEMGKPIPETFALRFEGFRNGDDETSLQEMPRAYTDADADSKEGDYVIHLDAVEAENYAVETHEGVLKIVGATAVKGVTVGSKHLGAVYTLAGVPVECPSGSLAALPKGIYIVDGRKIVVR